MHTGPVHSNLIRFRYDKHSKAGFENLSLFENKSPSASLCPPTRLLSEVPTPPLAYLPTLLSSSASFGLQLFRFHQSGDP